MRAHEEDELLQTYIKDDVVSLKLCSKLTNTENIIILPQLLYKDVMSYYNCISNEIIHLPSEAFLYDSNNLGDRKYSQYLVI